MKRGLREYWEEQLSEYRNSGLTIQEYSDLKDLPYETGRRWTVYLKKERAPEAAPLKLVELISLAACRSEIFGFGKSMSIPIDA